MASSSEKSAAKANLLGKRNLEDDLVTESILKKHKDNSEEKQIELLETKSEQANLISVKEADLLGKRNLEDDLETKRILKETTKESADTSQQIELLETKSDHFTNLSSLKEPTKRKRTLYVGNLSCDTEISDIIDFFKDVGQVVHVRVIVNHKGKHMGYSYVQFATPNQARMALHNKNGEYLHDHKIVLGVARQEQYYPRRVMYCINHKVWYKDDYLGQESLLIEEDETAQGLDEYPYFVNEATLRNKTLLVANLSPQTKISDIIDFFKNVGEVVRVRLAVNQMCQHRNYGLVEFASTNDTKKALQKKNGEFLDDSKIHLAVAKKEQPPKFCFDHKVWSGHYLRQESLPIEQDETPSDFVEDVLFVANLSPQTKILNVIHFFNNVGVVSVRLIVNHEGKHVGYGFVEFASSYDAKKALEAKNGEYLLDHKIFLDVVKSAPYPPGPKHNLAEMLCYDDYLRRESLMIEEDEAVEGLDETPDFVEAVAIRKKTLFVTNLSPQTKILNIIDFFKGVGEVVHVRLIVNYLGKHVGDGFVEFASAKEAKKALKKKNGEYLHDRKILLDVARTDQNLPRPMYCIDHKVWYEDYLGRESLLIEEDEAVEGLDETPDYIEEVAIRKKTLFVAVLPHITNVANIINFFKDVGEVRRVRLVVNDRSERMGCGFVEFASANEAKKALRIKNGERLCGRKIYLYVVEMAPYPIRPKYNHAEMLWNKDHLQEEEDDDLVIKQKVPMFCGTKITFTDDD